MPSRRITPDRIYVGCCYERVATEPGDYTTIRFVDKIKWLNGSAHVEFVSRRETDPVDTWPGSGSAYLSVFCTNTTRQVPAPCSLPENSRG